MRMSFFGILTLLLPLLAQGKVFETFDGRFYNGLYYPVVDAIEWGEQNGELPHMEFHIHSKDKPIDLVAVPGDKNGKPVLWLMYDLKFRGERICRHILAPAHFTEGMKLYAYRDNSDSDYDNIYFSSEPMSGKHMTPYQMPAYAPCTDEHASNKPDSAANTPAPASTTPAASAPSTPAPAAAVKKDGKNIGVDYDNHAVPFSF
jgi:hypothetical protein